MSYVPDYRYMLEVLLNRRPDRLPLYEHIISPRIMERILNTSFAELEEGSLSDQAEFFNQYCRFFKEMTYDTVSYEVCVTSILPDHGALMGGRPGPIQNRRDFEQYPWDEIGALYWKDAAPRFEILTRCLPSGMKALGGIGNGIFEISEDLVGFEYLSYMQVDDPDLFADIYIRIGDIVVSLWREFLERYSEHFAICRFGDDLGYKTGPLLNPQTIRQQIIPQYKRIIDLIHRYKRPFLWHSCGCIFEIMDDIIALGIDAKHSNEDIIAPFDDWIARYSNRIGLLGGIDVDILCQFSPEEIFDRVVESGRRFRANAEGYALGSGNSIPDYVPTEGYLAMIRAAQHLRVKELIGSPQHGTC